MKQYDKIFIPVDEVTGKWVMPPISGKYRYVEEQLNIIVLTKDELREYEKQQIILFMHWLAVESPDLTSSDFTEEEVYELFKLQTYGH